MFHPSLFSLLCQPGSSSFLLCTAIAFMASPWTPSNFSSSHSFLMLLPASLEAPVSYFCSMIVVVASLDDDNTSSFFQSSHSLIFTQFCKYSHDLQNSKRPRPPRTQAGRTTPIINWFISIALRRAGNSDGLFIFFIGENFPFLPDRDSNPGPFGGKTCLYPLRYGAPATSKIFKHCTLHVYYKIHITGMNPDTAFTEAIPCNKMSCR